jgi:hypothetical protein
MSNPQRGLRAFNLFSLILLGCGLVLILSTAYVQAEVLSNWDATWALLRASTSPEAAKTVLDPTGGLILQRYMIGGIFVLIGFIAHFWISKHRKEEAPAAA